MLLLLRLLLRLRLRLRLPPGLRQSVTSLWRALSAAVSSMACV
eukprot:COSAG01_NODE_15350_length_1347_cov_5.686699_2_plen_43_part_00